MNQRITLEQPPAALDASGEASGTWKTFARTWASVNPLRGRQLEMARTVYADVSVQINMRYLDGVKAKMRVRHGDNVYQIEAVMDVNSRHDELELLCSGAQ